MANSQRSGDAAVILVQLEDLKKLMVIQLVASGVQATHIAKALGVDKSAISRLVPVREIQKAGASTRRTED
jgi:IS30 family transposase